MYENIFEDVREGLHNYTFGAVDEEAVGHSSVTVYYERSYGDGDGHTNESEEFDNATIVKIADETFVVGQNAVIVEIEGEEIKKMLPEGFFPCNNVTSIDGGINVGEDAEISYPGVGGE